MMERGYLDSREMGDMFSLLRSNDLIWANVVNNYLLGNKPPAFDLLYWNSDGTRMTRAAHSWYLRNTYVENNLIKPGKITLKGEAIDLGRIRQDTYAVGCEKDHIVPWDSAWRITQLFGGEVRYVLASSGHVAGIINPPGGKGSLLDTGGGRRCSEQPGAVAAERDEARRQLVAGLVGLALRSGRFKERATAFGQRAAPAAGGCTGDLRPREVGTRKALSWEPVRSASNMANRLYRSALLSALHLIGAPGVTPGANRPRGFRS